MSILKYKYKIHKFINSAFYIVVFVTGFLLGFGAKEVNFSKLISQFLMIDSVSAYNIPIKNNNVPINEEFIYNTFSELYDEFNIKETPYIFCYSSGGNYVCDAVDSEYLDLLYLGNAWSDYYYINRNPGTASAFSFTGCQSTSCISKSSSNWGLEINFNTFSFLVPKSTPYATNRGIYSNFILSDKVSGTEVLKGTHNVFDFSDYEVNLEFNENVFKDNPDFKEVCIEKGKKYGITTTNIDPISNTAFVSDFIWFPGKTTGVKYSEYDSLNDDNILIFNDDISTENYYFEDKDKIDSFYNDDIISNYFNHSGYTDKYSYYGYTAYKFMHSYYVDDNNDSQNMFTIFDFSDINFSPFGSAGGSSSSFGDTPLKYCFYIKNEFNVTELKTDEWNDYTGVVPTPGGDLEVNTSHNKNNSNTEEFLSQPKNFIASMKDTINFINSLIYKFYMSLPVLLKTFIITVLIILIIMLIMKIGGYK